MCYFKDVFESLLFYSNIFIPFCVCFALILKVYNVLGSEQNVWSFVFSVPDEFEVNKLEPTVPVCCWMSWDWYLSLVDIMIFQMNTNQLNM